MTPFALPFHDRDGVLGRQHRAEQVDIDQRMKILDRKLGDLLIPQQARVRVDAIQPAEMRHRQIDGGLHVRFLRHVAEMKNAVVAFIDETLGHDFPLLGLDRHGDDLGALPGEKLGAGQADAGGAAGDEDDFVFEVGHAGVPPGAI